MFGLRGLVALVASMSVGRSAHATENVLVIYPQEFAAPVAAWIAHRSTFGGNCYPASEFVILESTVESVAGQDGILEPPELLNYIVSVSTESGSLDYIVLVGTSSIIPSYPLNGSNVVVDDVYGMEDESGGFRAAVGRIPANTVAEATNIVNKIVLHDHSQWAFGPGASHWDDALFTVEDVSAASGEGPSRGAYALDAAEYLAERALSGSYAGCGSIVWGRGSEIPISGDARAEFVRSEIERGVGLWLAFGSLSAGGNFVRFLYTDPGRPNQLNVESWPVSEKVPFVVGVSCNLGEGLAESGAAGVVRSLVVAEGKGIIGAFAPTSSVDPMYAGSWGAALASGIATAPPCGVYDPVGEILRVVKNAAISGDWYDELTVRSTMLIGDPTMKVPAWGPFVRITSIVNGNAMPYPNSYVRMWAEWEDPALLPEAQNAHTWAWSATKGQFCAVSPGEDPLLWCPSPNPTDSNVWFRCPGIGHPASECVGQSTITVQVTQGRTGASPYQVYPCNQADTTFTVTFKAKPVSGCPVVQVLKNGQWEDRNSILGQSAYEAEGIMREDWYAVQEPAGAATSPVIQFRVREATEGERTTLDFAEMWVVDRTNGVPIWTDQDGGLWTASGVVSPAYIGIKNGPPLIDELSSQGDGNTIVVSTADTLVAIWEDDAGPARTGQLLIDGESKPLLVTWVGLGYPRGVRILPGGSVSGGDVIMPRQNWYASVVDSPSITRGDGVPDTVFVGIGEYHDLDRIALLDGRTAWTSKVVKPLMLATHSVDGNVTTALASAGNTYSLLEYGEHVQVQFAYPYLPAGTTRTLVLRVRGSYSRTGQFIESASGQPWLWGIRNLLPNPSTGDVFVVWNRAGAEECDLTVFGVDGRRVRTLCKDMADRRSEFTRWDGRDDARRRVAAGVYFVRLTEGERVDDRKVVLIR